jgi:hypothetical protein
VAEVLAVPAVPTLSAANESVLGVVAWLKLLALNGDLAKAEPKTLRYLL